MSRLAGFWWLCLTLLLSAGCASHSAAVSGPTVASQVVYQNISVMANDDRPVDVRVFYQAAGCDGCPLILFSHGANATYDRYDVLLQAWAREGYVVAAPLHVDSELHPRRADYGREDHLPTRLEDVAATLEYLQTGEAEGIAGISLAPDYIAAGHSFGALIAQIAGGARLPDQSLDGMSRPLAVIAVSPPGPVPGFIEPSAWSSIEAPMLVTTGTTDFVPFVAPAWEDHLASFENAPAALSGALIFDDIDHYFNGAFGRIDEVTAADSAVENLNKAITAFIRQVRGGIPVADMRLLEEGATGVQFITRENHD